jgi:Tripartite tricarboxylate transporter TctB family
VSGRRIAEAMPSLVLAVIAAAYVWVSYDYAIGSRRLPWIAGVMAIVFVLLDLVAKRERAPTAAAHAPWQEAVMFAWIGGFLPLVVVLGFYAAIPLYVFCYLRLYAGKAAVTSAATAFGVAGFLYVVFEVLMGYEIFGGLIAGDVL